MPKKTLAALVAIAAENSLLFMAYGATQRVVSRLVKLENDELGVLGHGLALGCFINDTLQKKKDAIPVCTPHGCI